VTDRKEYRVGRFVLRPHRQLLDGEVPVAIGRKALELLSVLAEAEGDLVTKDELMAAVWPKAIVEDNAIQVHIAALRKLLGPDADRISTTHGLGYRLAVTRPVEALTSASASRDETRAEVGAGQSAAATPAGYRASGPQAPPERAPLPATAIAKAPPRRPRLVAGIGMALLAGLAVATLKLTVGATANTVGVDHVRVPEGDQDAALFADGLAGALARQVERRATGMRVLDARAPAGGARPALLLDGEARSLSGRLNIVMQIHAAKDPTIVWSETFDGPLADVAGVRRQTAMELAAVLTCAVRDGDPPSGGEVLSLMLSACEAIQSNDARSEAIRDILREAVTRAPHFARGWSELAVAEAFVTTHHDDLPELAAVDGRQAEADARHALELDPRQEGPWLARAILAHHLGQWILREADFHKAAALDPEDSLASGEHGDAMAEVGRMKEAMALHRRAADLDPLSEDMASRLAGDEAYAGDWAGAQATLDAADRLWPSHKALRGVRFSLAAKAADPALALRLFENPAMRPEMSSADGDFWRRLVAARNDPTRAAEAAAYFVAHAGKDLDFLLSIEGLAILGRADQAMDVLDHNVAGLSAGRGATSILFRHAFMKGVLSSPRFMPLAARIGLVRIWRQTGRWPDFCTAPDAPYDCKFRAQVAENAPTARRIQTKS
jgi:DNA-binding winged helix-turn-helix (wHTH) protein/tetratricopeptide (TPR) repeat protein